MRQTLPATSILYRAVGICAVSLTMVQCAMLPRTHTSGVQGAQNTNEPLGAQKQNLAPFLDPDSPHLGQKDTVGNVAASRTHQRADNASPDQAERDTYAHTYTWHLPHRQLDAGSTSAEEILTFGALSFSSKPSCEPFGKPHESQGVDRIDRDLPSSAHSRWHAQLALHAFGQPGTLTLHRKDAGQLQLNWQGATTEPPLGFERILQFSPEESERWVAELCRLNRQQTYQTGEGVASLSRLLQQALPECDFRLTSDSLTCDVHQTRSAATELKELRALQRHFGRTWKRLPYPLTRKLKTATQLAKSLEGDTLKRLDAFCKMTELSYPTELPLAMRGSAWQPWLCPQSFEQPSPSAALETRKAAALQLLAYTMQELSALNALYRTRTLVGTLRPKFRDASFRRQVLMVHIEPDAEADFADAMGSRQQPESAGACASVFLEPARSIDLERLLHLSDASNKTGLRARVGCLQLARDSAEGLADGPAEGLANGLAEGFDAYLFAQLSSQTEFEVSNGHRIVLQLPRGNYSYKARTLDGKHTVTGNFRWKKTVNLRQPPLKLSRQSTGSR